MPLFHHSDVSNKNSHFDIFLPMFFSMHFNLLEIIWFIQLVGPFNTKHYKIIYVIKIIYRLLINMAC